MPSLLECRLILSKCRLAEVRDLSPSHPIADQTEEQAAPELVMALDGG